MSNQKSPFVYIVILNWNGYRDTVECLESVLRQDYPNYHVVICDNASSDGSVENIQRWAAGEYVPDIQGPLSHLCNPPVNKPVMTERLSNSDKYPARTHSSKVTIIETGGNLGFAGGNNVGIRYAMQQNDCDFVWLLNNDTVIETDTLREMVIHSSKLTEKGVKNTCGSLVRFYDDPNVIQALGGAAFNRLTGIATQTLGRFLAMSDDIDHRAVEEELDYITACSWLIPRHFIDDIGLMEERYFL